MKRDRSPGFDDPDFDHSDPNVDFASPIVRER